MKESTFRQILVKLYPKVSLEQPLPIAAIEVAAYCFVNQIRNLQAHELRMQLHHLNKHGVFNFEKENT